MTLRDVSSYHWKQLRNAALQCGIEIPSNLHRARVDAELTRQVVMHMAQAGSSTVIHRTVKVVAAPLYL